jgi:thiamine-phosphate diphosphorylase/hydroxyethylthiazole kinase
MSADGRTGCYTGGIKSTNLLRTLHGCTSAIGHALDGIAVVSDIVASSDPRAAASRLAQTFRAWAAAASRGPTGFLVTPEQKAQYTREGIVTAAAALVDTVRRERPLVHQVLLQQQPPAPAQFYYTLTSH